MNGKWVMKWDDYREENERLLHLMRSKEAAELLVEDYIDELEFGLSDENFRRESSRVCYSEKIYEVDGKRFRRQNEWRFSVKGMPVEG